MRVPNSRVVDELDSHDTGFVALLVEETPVDVPSVVVKAPAIRAARLEYDGVKSNVLERQPNFIDIILTFSQMLSNGLINDEVLGIDGFRRRRA